MERMTPAGTGDDPCGDQVPARWPVELVSWELSGMLVWCLGQLGTTGWYYQLISAERSGMRMVWGFDRRESAVLFQMVWC